MKITLTFLFLGCCLAFTNAFGARGTKMGKSEAFSHGRVYTVIMRRYSDLQACHTCSNFERLCLEKAIVQDIFFMLRMMSADLKCTPRDLISSANFKFSAKIFIDSVETDDADGFTVFVRNNRLMDHIMQTFCSLLKEPMKDAGVDIGEIVGTVNQATGGVLDAALSVVGSVLGTVGHLVGGLTSAVGGITDSIGLGGISNTIGGLTGGLLGGGGGHGGATGALGGLGGLTGGLTGTLGGLLGGGRGHGGATGALGGLGGLTGGLTGTLGGLLGGGGGATGGALGGLG